jgi:hypothetical protein
MGADYQTSLNKTLKTILEERPTSTPILIPTSASEGRLTTLIQYSFEIEKPTNIMIRGLVNSIVNDMRKEVVLLNGMENKTKEILIEKISSFID